MLTEKEIMNNTLSIKDYIRLCIVFTIAHILAYLVSGTIIQPLYEPLWRGETPLLSAYLRTAADPELYKQAMIWAFPAQFLRGILLAVGLFPILATLKNMSFWNRYIFLFGLFTIYLNIACSAPGANIEGLIYLKPIFVKKGFLPGFLESLMHSATAAFVISKFINIKTKKAT